MAWNRKQNPTGYAQPAVRDIPLPSVGDPTDVEARDILRLHSKGHIPDTSGLPPISASARKADGFAPQVTGDVV